MKIRNWLTAFFACAASFPLVSGELLPYTVKTMKMEGDYYRGQQLKGTENNLNEKSAKTAEERAWYEIQAFTKFNDAKALSDGKLSAGIRTYAWSSHGKRITITAELNGLCEVEKIEVGQHPYANELIERIEVSIAEAKLGDEWLWQTPAVVTQHSLREQQHYFTEVKIGRKAAALRIVCSNYKPLSLALTEIRIFGKPADGTSASADVPAGVAAAAPPGVPEETFRMELESIRGPWKNRSGAAVGGGGIWSGGAQYAFQLKNPGKAEKYQCWIRFSSTEPQTVKIGSSSVKLPPQNVKWTRCGTFTGESAVIVYGAGPSWGDSLLLSADPAFDPNKLDPRVLEKLVPEIHPETEYAERLLKEQPDIEPAEFARKVVEHYGMTYHEPGRCVDENNSILVDGKPFFPMLCYGLSPNLPLYYDTGCNTSHGSGVWEYSTDKYVVGGRERFAFDRQVRDVLGFNPANVAFIHLFDEPENHPEFTYRKFVLLNALMKAMMPNTVTSVNFAANSNSRDCFVVSDVLSVDHYPVPKGSIADIGYTCDYMRYHGKNRPLIFIAQIFNWGGKGNRFPTSNEICAMTLLPLIHGVKGLQWYEMCVKNPSRDPDAFTKLSPVDYPEQWKRFCEMTKAVASIRDALLGPELKPCFTTEKENPAEFRVAVTADRKKAYLIAVNPENRELSAKADFSAHALKDLQLIPLADFGCRATAEGSCAEFRFEAAGSGIFEVRSAHLAELEKLSGEEFLSLMKERFSNVKPNQEITAALQKGKDPDWNAASDLMKTWKSPIRPDSAKLLVNEAGVHLQLDVRYQIGRKSVITQRDGPVWRDVSLELFLARPGTEDYAHLMLNTLNTQADVKYTFGPEGKMTDADSVFEWESEASCETETAHFRIFIPWKTMKSLIGIEPGGSFTMNVCSQGRDWCGLTGGGYHVPLKFGRINVTK